MDFDPPLVHGEFVRRYKRFFVDVRLADGETVVAHCTNTGALRGCLVEGAPVMIERADNPRRKLKWTWVMIELDGEWVGVDTMRATPLVREAIASDLLPELHGYDRLYPEVPYGSAGRSRIDLLLSRGGTVADARPGRRTLPHGDERVYLEVKNTTLVHDEDVRVAAFPDAVTERGLKHLHELRDVAATENRAALVFSIQRDDCFAFRPADEIHPAYGQALRAAVDDGVEVFALAAEIGPERIALRRRLPIRL